jgi:hypothetical protein
MGWSIYLYVYKNSNSTANEEILKEEIDQICSQQFVIPGSEPLWTAKEMSRQQVPGNPTEEYEMFMFYFSKIQNSLNPFLTIVLTIVTGQKLLKQFGDEIEVAIHDDYGFPFKRVEDYSSMFLTVWMVLGMLLTPLWLVVLVVLKIYQRIS